MIHENTFSRNRELKQAKLNAEKKSLETKNTGTNQAQLGNQKFQDIADNRYNEKLSQLQGKKFNAEEMMKNAKKEKKKMDVLRDMTFYKKWN